MASSKRCGCCVYFGLDDVVWIHLGRAGRNDLRVKVVMVVLRNEGRAVLKKAWESGDDEHVMQEGSWWQNEIASPAWCVMWPTTALVVQTVPLSKFKITVRLPPSSLSSSFLYQSQVFLLHPQSRHTGIAYV